MFRFLGVNNLNYCMRIEIKCLKLLLRGEYNLGRRPGGTYPHTAVWIQVLKL